VLADTRSARGYAECWWEELAARARSSPRIFTVITVPRPTAFYTAGFSALLSPPFDPIIRPAECK